MLLPCTDLGPTQSNFEEPSPNGGHSPPMFSTTVGNPVPSRLKLLDTGRKNHNQQLPYLVTALNNLFPPLTCCYIFFQDYLGKNISIVDNLD